MRDDVISLLQTILEAQQGTVSALHEAVKAINSLSDRMAAVERRIASLEKQDHPEQPRNRR